MTRDELRALITHNLAAAGVAVSPDGIHLQADPFGGWRVAVIAQGFAGKTQSERRTLALAGVEPTLLQWVDLLTPEEQEWAGELPLDQDVERLPLWPEALAERCAGKPPVFPSSLDEDLSPPIVTTFYSLRGGVGRSTALVYTSQVLARRGHTVLCVDLDLEAPGLAALYGVEDQVREGTGTLSALLQLDQGETPNLLDHLMRVSSSHELYCLPAGVVTADYARRFRLIDPESWYRR